MIQTTTIRICDNPSINYTDKEKPVVTGTCDSERHFICHRVWIYLKNGRRYLRFGPYDICQECIQIIVEGLSPPDYLKVRSVNCKKKRATDREPR